MAGRGRAPHCERLTSREVAARAGARSPRGPERGAILLEYVAVLALVVVAALAGLAELGDLGRGVLRQQAECVATPGPGGCVHGGAAE